MSKRLEGKVALVTGSTSGIGLAIAQLFSQEGARVILSGRRRPLGEQAVQQIRDAGGEASYFATDFSRMEAVRQAVRFTLDRYGRLDILVNNTVSWNTARDMPVTLLKEEDWDYTLAVGLKAPYVACQEAIPAMVDQGRWIDHHDGFGAIIPCVLRRVRLRRSQGGPGEHGASIDS
jgi:NAD(P)-dependent dehydrogenase (short-subunit alcohol dehydrogenase family)